MDEEIRFDFSGGVLCLDFCNTADGDLNREWKERLLTVNDLIAWVHDAGVLSAEEAERLTNVALHNPDDALRSLEHARSLRSTLYHIFAALAHDNHPDLTAFNVELQAAGAHMRLVPSDHDDHFTWAWADHTLEKILWPIIWSASQLLVSDDLGEVRECAGSTCSWLFLDTSRNHSRRWCDMSGCGNRAKARRHYHRTKTQES